MIRKVLILEARKLVLLNAVTFNCVKMLLLSNLKEKNLKQISLIKINSKLI